jgi:hypothetical protein
VGYDVALQKSWSELSAYSNAAVEVRFLGRDYLLDPSARSAYFKSGGPAAIGAFTLILLLHYASARCKVLPKLSGRWVTFRELPLGGEFYYPAFRRRAIEPLLRKYGADPQAALAVVSKRFPGLMSISQDGDCAFVLEVFSPGVPVKVILWKQDEEFSAEAVMFFERNISGIFCTEDVAVLAGIVTASLSR